MRTSFPPCTPIVTLPFDLLMGTTRGRGNTHNEIAEIAKEVSGMERYAFDTLCQGLD